MSVKPLRIAVVGAGPVGLALGLLASRSLPQAHITLLDARPLERDVSLDPRTLALALGSVQLLQRLKAWPPGSAQAITEVHVSQAPPTLQSSWLEPEVTLRASEEGVPQLGAVLSYGQLVAPLQAAWLARAAAAPERLHSAFGTAVKATTPVAGGVELDTDITETFDLCVVAEGGVFAEQSRKAITRDYQQNAWVGTATVQGQLTGRAIERFTRHGPLALLPLPADATGQARAALVWCVPSGDDPVRGLSDAQRITLLNSLLPAEAGTVMGLSPLKTFALGLNAERSLVNGRLVRIGNAAQTLHPVAGQGLNLGLRDAMALVEALRHDTDVDRALRKVAWARGPDRYGMIFATDFLARSFTWSWLGLGALRGLGLAALKNAAPLKSALAKQMMFGSR